MTTLAQKLETLRARTAKKIAAVETIAEAKIASANDTANAKIAKLTAMLYIETTRLEAINGLDAHDTLDESEAEPDMNTQTETTED